MFTPLCLALRVIVLDRASNRTSNVDLCKGYPLRLKHNLFEVQICRYILTEITLFDLVLTK